MPETLPEPKSPKQQRPSSPWAEALVRMRWPLTLIALAVVALLVYWLTLQRIDRVGSATENLARDAARGAAETAEAVAKGFLTGNVTERFLSAIPQIDSSGSGLLEVATSSVTETFTRTDERRVLWDAFSLGVNTTEVKVPVTYRYHIRLDEPWRIEIDDQTCIVYAPKVRPTQPPAIHTEGIERRIEESWLRFDADEQLAHLESGITPRLRQMAQDPRHLNLVRETARKTLAEFVRGWLLQEDQWRQDRLRIIQVVFPQEEEPAEGSPPNVITLRLDED